MDIYARAKKEFEKHYDSTLTVQENQPIKVGSVTKPMWVTVIEGVPCRISKKQINPVGSGEFAGTTQLITLYCAPEIDIKSGSKITVTDHRGLSRNYQRSSEGFNSYKTHQEIVITRDVIA